MNAEVLTIEKMAEILQIKPNTMHNKKWQKRTQCPLIKIGKRLYAIAEEFWKWIKEGKRG